MKKYVLDNSWKLADENLDAVAAKLKYADRLEAFVLEPRLEAAQREMDRVSNVREENFTKFLDACVYVGLPRVYLGKKEIVGADNIDTFKTPTGWERHAIWALIDLLNEPYGSTRDQGIGAGCGNTDQYQVYHADKFFEPRRLAKAYSTATRRRVSIEPFKKRFVVTPGRPGRDRDRRLSAF